MTSKYEGEGILRYRCGMPVRLDPLPKAPKGGHKRATMCQHTVAALARKMQDVIPAA